jgi:hypothetical protein
VGLKFFLVLCLAGIFCLSPLALYLLWTAKLTRRARPVVLAGTWDFVALLAGLSGFILFGGGLVISLLESNARYWMRGNFEALRDAWNQEKVAWLLLSGSYVSLVMVAVLFALASRRRSIVFYNIDTAAFEASVAEVFEHLNRPVERRGNVWYSGPASLFELDPFPRGRTATLRWLTGDLELFQEVDRNLREAVRSQYTDTNVFSQWILAAAIWVSIAAVACLGSLAFVMRVI